MRSDCCSSHSHSPSFAPNSPTRDSLPAISRLSPCCLSPITSPIATTVQLPLHPNMTYPLHTDNTTIVVLPSFVLFTFCSSQCLLSGELKSLTVLNLNMNRLSEIPPDISGLVNLKYLSVEHNSLMHIPEELCQLQHLQEIRLGYNYLESIPTQLHKLKKLKSLHLHRNNIKELPKEIFKCYQLQVLDVASNNLNIFPMRFNELNLVMLHFECNPLLMLDCVSMNTQSRVLPLKELVVRFVMNEMKRYYKPHWKHIMQSPQVKDIIQDGKYCLICDGFFLDIYNYYVSYHEIK
ncbi:hypothetical protein Ahia01_001218200, partial [Argonauta hians]